MKTTARETRQKHVQEHVEDSTYTTVDDITEDLQNLTISADIEGTRRAPVPTFSLLCYGNYLYEFKVQKQGCGGFLFDAIRCTDGMCILINCVDEETYLDSEYVKNRSVEVGYKMFRFLCRNQYGEDSFPIFINSCIFDLPVHRVHSYKDLYLNYPQVCPVDFERFYSVVYNGDCDEDGFILIKRKTRRDGSRWNKKEIKQKNYKNYIRKINKKDIEPHSRDVNDFSGIYIPVLARYTWRSQRPQMDELYENFMDMVSNVYPNMTDGNSDYRLAFDIMDVWLCRVSSYFHRNPYSLLPGPPLEEQLLCEIIVVCNDVHDLNLPFIVIGWMVYNYHLRNNVLGYFVYWYQHYKSYVSNDQIVAIAYPRSDVEPHGGKYRRYREPTREQLQMHDLEESEWLANNVPSDGEGSIGRPESDCDFDFDAIPDPVCKDDDEMSHKFLSESSELVEEVKRAIADFPGTTDRDAERWISHIESLAILGRQLYKAMDAEDCVLAVIAYVKIYCKSQSAIIQIREIASWNIPDEEIIPHGLGQDVVDGWNLCRQNKNFKRVSYLISAALSMSICSIKELNWTVAGFNVLTIQAAKEQLNAVDLIDSLVKTFTWIARSGYNVFVKGDIRSVFYDDQRMENFLTDCDDVLAYADKACAGNMDDELNDYKMKLDSAIDHVIELKRAQNGGPHTLWLQKKYSDLIGIKERIIAKDRTTAMRFAPIGFSISGPTGIGKSTLSNLTMRTSLEAMGFESTSNRVITLDTADKYQSTYTSDINGMYIDDFANTKSKFEEVAPTSYIIKFFNNVAAQAIKAEIQSKGVVFINFKCGVITTNTKELDVRQYSNCPESILRRFYHVTATVLPQYRRDGCQLDNFHPDLLNASITKNVWEINVEEVVTRADSDSPLGKKTGGDSAYNFRTVVIPNFNGQINFVCEKLDLKTYLQVVVYLSRRHKISQHTVVRRAEEYNKVVYCKLCSLPGECCSCVSKIVPNSYEVVLGLTVGVIKDVIFSYLNRGFQPIYMLNRLLGWRYVREWATNELTHEMHGMMDAVVIPFMLACIPESMLQVPIIRKAILRWQQLAAFLSVPRLFWACVYVYCIGIGLALMFGARNWFLIACSFAFFVLSLFFIALGWYARLREVQQEFCSRRDVLPVYVKSFRDKYVPGAACLALGIAMLTIWNRCRKRSMKRICPNSLMDPVIVDEKPSWQGYFSQFFGGSVETSLSSQTATLSQVGHTLEKNLFFCSFERPDGSLVKCNILFPRKCVAIFPLHIFYKDSDLTRKPADFLKLTVCRKPDLKSAIFTCSVGYEQSVIYTDRDLVFSYIPNCPDIKDMLKWLPLDKPTGNMLSQFMVRDELCRIHRERVHITFCQTGHRYVSFYGGNYVTTLAHRGSCMGVLISENKTPCVLGVHLGGAPGKNYGVMQTITYDDVCAAIESLQLKPGVLLSSLVGDIPQKQYDIPVISSYEVHPNAHFIHKLDAEAHVDILGSTALRSSMKSQVKDSLISRLVTKYCGVENIWGPPKLEPNWVAFNASLDYIVHPALMHIPQHLERARQDWLAPLSILIEKQSVRFGIRPLTPKEMVLGRDGVRFLDAIPMSTSMGFPLFGQKAKHFTEIRNGECLLDRIPSEQITFEMNRLMRCWKAGYRGYPVVSATLKDEPTLRAKEKVRVFEAISVAFGLYVRKYFLPIARFLSLNPLISESAVGVNAFSPDWDELMSFVEKYDSHELMGWDYSKYDLRMNSQMTRAVLLSYIELAKKAGYSEEDIFIMQQMVNDMVHPLMDYNGTMLMVYNMNTSGNNITVNINSTANSLYIRMCFFAIYPKHQDFRSVCSLMTYGDDGIASVDKEFRDFNISAFIAYMGEHDMKVTLPTKDDRTDVRFLPVSELDFLKRKSYFIPEIKCRIGQLDENSIFKSLHCNLASKVATDMEVAIAVIESAMHEWFAFGRAHYDMRMEQMRKVCNDLKIPVTHAFVSYDYRVEDWLRKYRSVNSYIEPQSNDYSSDALCFGRGRNYKQYKHERSRASPMVDLFTIYPENNKNERGIHGTRRHGESIRKLEQFLEVDSSTYFEYALYTSIITVGLILAALCTTKSEMYDTISECDIEPQADEVQQYSEMPAPDSQKVHNITFDDSRPGYMEIMDGTMDPLRHAPLIQDATLQDFFSRPLKIASFRWGVGSSFFEDVDPWSLYFNNPRVVNRISNFKLMHAKMHVKFIINGTPFHYGRLLASYTPLPLTDQMTRNVALIEADLVQASQRPHVYINPTSSIGGEMLLPFFLPQNVLDITYYDWRLMGEINIRSLQNLKHANGAVDTVTVSVFAWAEEVKMAVPTQFEPGTIVPQADEYGDSPLSKMASATAAAMKPLMLIPTIAPFARATEIGALAVSSIAKMYGYAKTPLISYGVMATTASKYQWTTTDVPDYVNKMSVDSKQELSIDPRTTGLDSTDEMSLLNIVKRESYLYSFPWQIGDLEEELLFNVVVDPCIYRSYVNGTDREIHMPACCYGALPFKYWRGTMRYRFQIVCSNFHRGRLKFVYDPTSGTTQSEYNVAYTTIVDISDNTDFCIEIGWGQPYTFKEHINFVNNSINTVLNTTTLPYSNNVVYGNGVLSVYVVNELTVPDTTINNDIAINVFVSACDDFEAAAPESIVMKRLRLTPPPAEAFAREDIEPQSEEVVQSEDSKPTDPPLLSTMGKSISTYDVTDKVHFGERISSFRQLAKRYDWFESKVFFKTAPTYAMCYAALRRNMFPYFPGWYTLPVPSVTEIAEGSNYAYSNFTWLHYISCAYAGWKGSTRYFVDATQWNGSPVQTAFRTSSGAPVAGTQLVTTTDNLNLLRFNATFKDNFVHPAQGGAISTNQTSLSFEVPYYSVARFTPARNYVQYTEDDAFMEKYIHVITTSAIGNINVRPIDYYVAGGEDFSTYFFLGAPIFYYEEGRPQQTS